MVDATRETPALIVRQWLSEWDEVNYSPEERRRKPEPCFYVFTMPARLLLRLSSIYRRKAVGPRALDNAIQREHDPIRSAEIARFVRGGFPWSELSDRQKRQEQFRDLRMPGWLPTAIVANILTPGTRRRNATISESDVVQVRPLTPTSATLILPTALADSNWRPKVAPIEIIDGQHRLWAFESNSEFSGDFEFPVVAFHDLDITWQAYLFYTINIKPKRINPSLAFDLYPVLRIQDWLERSPAGPAIYRETRAQELTEVLWSHPASPWRGRISMLGQRKEGFITQAAFIRSLMASYVKRWEGRRVSIGGLFGSELHAHGEDPLHWDRGQQAAFLIAVWAAVAEAAAACQEEWAVSLRTPDVQPELPLRDPPSLDPAFCSKHSLLATDQGVRGVLQVTNDMCFVAADHIHLTDWSTRDEVADGAVAEAAVSAALESFQDHPASDFLRAMAAGLCRFDWRASSWPDLSDEQRALQMIYRGSGGYREVRRRLIHCLKSSRDRTIRGVAAEVCKRLGY